MNLGKQLYDLQQIDLDLESKAELLGRVNSQLSEDRALVEAKAEAEIKQKHLAELEKKQKAEEWATEDLQAKASPLQKKLDTGATRNPKELLSLQEQVKHLKQQLREGEDRVLELMSQVENLQKELASMTDHVRKLEGEWQKKRGALSAEQAELTMVIDIAEKRRGELTANIEPAHLELYETLRAKRQGQAVAKIEQGRCQGCRISLPVSELGRARVGGLVQCSSCDRVLYLG